jgi:transposase
MNLIKAYRATGRLTPKPSGGCRHAKLDPHREFLLGRVTEKADITMLELASALEHAVGVRADPFRSRAG